MNREIQKVTEWVNSNKLSLNISKTSYMVFKTRKRRLHITNDIIINKNIISRVQSTQFLGVILDCHLIWDKHINHIGNKISKSFGILKKSKD